MSEYPVDAPIRPQLPKTLSLGKAGVNLQTLEDMKTFAEILRSSSFAPKDATVPNIVISVQYGMEIGLSPMQSIQNVSVINGRPAVWGDAMPALVMSSGLLEDMKEELVNNPQGGVTAICTVKRRGISTPKTVRFSMEDAKRAGLAGKQGPWTNYPHRMLQMRARSFALRDMFADVLKGLIAVEEAMDIPVENEPVQRQVTVALPDVFPASSMIQDKEVQNEPAVEAPPVPHPLDPVNVRRGPGRPSKAELEARKARESKMTTGRAQEAPKALPEAPKAPAPVQRTAFTRLSEAKGYIQALTDMQIDVGEWDETHFASLSSQEQEEWIKGMKELYDSERARAAGPQTT